MSAKDPQSEIKRLTEVCEQLDALANQHSFVGEVLAGSAGNLRNSATLLELLVAAKVSN